jgi:hypothetical protein
LAGTQSAPTVLGPPGSGWKWRKWRKWLSDIDGEQPITQGVTTYRFRRGAHGRNDISLKIGIHEGPCLAVLLNPIILRGLAR